ncbi:tetratricopeptide repeat-containing diguanylate cyclase [Deinococcus sp.]|uniref:tetratricopeptide repeat-containing diguanylate cyclase n=1 Tax=Deinococcus sp. TaxID=47478 RepID=UPI003C7C3C56
MTDPTEQPTVPQLLELAEALRSRDPERAYATALLAYDLAAASGNASDLAHAKLRLGSAASRMARNIEASEWLTGATEALPGLGHLEAAAQARVRLAKVKSDLGEFDQARALLDHVARDPASPVTERIDALTLLGNIHVEQGHAQAALEAFETCLTACDDAGDDEGRAMVLGNLGNLWASVGESGEAVRVYTEALAIYRSRDDNFNVAVGMVNLGETHEREEAWSAALAAYSEAETYAKSNASLRKMARAGRIRLLVETGDLPEARAVWGHGGNTASGGNTVSGDDPRADAWWKVSGAVMEAQEGAVARAVALADAATVQLEQHGVRGDLIQAHGLLARTLAAVGAYPQAYRHLERHHLLERAERTAQFESRVHLPLMRLEMRRHLETHASLQERSETLAQQALQDSLTGLGNRRALDATLPGWYAAARASGEAMSVVMIDIDHFKRLNDAYSHVVGDRVLQDLARRLLAVTRDTDLIARYGGEEFVVILRQCDLEAALVWYRRVRADLDPPWDGLPAGVGVTLSVGICADLGLGGAEAMLRDADGSLYTAKQRGRDQVCPDR